MDISDCRYFVDDIDKEVANGILPFNLIPLSVYEKGKRIVLKHVEILREGAIASHFEGLPIVIPKESSHIRDTIFACHCMECDSTTDSYTVTAEGRTTIYYDAEERVSEDEPIKPNGYYEIINGKAMWIPDINFEIDPPLDFTNDVDYVPLELSGGFYDVD